MLKKPKFGWTAIVIDGKELGRASEICDVPDILLDAFIQRLDPNNHLPLGLSLDAEGWDVGLVEMAEELYFFDTNTDSDIPNLTNLTTQAGKGCDQYILELAEELASDITRDLDQWVDFGVFEGPTDRRELKIQENKNRLLAKTVTLQSLVPKAKSK